MDDLFDVQEEREPVSTVSQGQGEEEAVGATKENNLGALHLVKLSTEGDVPQLYLLTESRPHLYYLQATDGHNSWTGVLSHRHINEIATKSNTSITDFMEYTRQAITTNNSELYQYATRLVGDSLELSWKKLVSNDIKLLLGSLVMEPHPLTGVHAKMLEHSVGAISLLRREINQLKAERDRLREDKSHSLKRLEETINLKDEIEGDLYAKFKLVLNEKKSKIRRLMESFQYMSSSRNSSAGTVPQDEQTGVPVTTVLEDETDDEMVVEKEQINEDKEATPSPKPKRSEVQKKEEILMDDWSHQTVSPPTKKRKRDGKKSKGGLSTLQKKSAQTSRNTRSRSKSSEASHGVVDEDQNQSPNSQELIEMM